MLKLKTLTKKSTK